MARKLAKHVVSTPTAHRWRRPRRKQDLTHPWSLAFSWDPRPRKLPEMKITSEGLGEGALQTGVIRETRRSRLNSLGGRLRLPGLFSAWGRLERQRPEVSS